MVTSQTKICLFGGSFDPIHLGHAYIANQAVSELKLDKVIFIPCQQSPHKNHATKFSSEQRLQMCHLATQDLTWAEVSDVEVISESPSYSWLTAEYFSKKFPHATLYWLMGTDQWNTLKKWEQPERFTSLVNIIVYGRHGSHFTENGFSCHPLLSLQHPASATMIRNQLSNSSTPNWLHPRVSNYIKENY